MTDIERALASELVVCPHCGKTPTVERITYDDEKSKWLDVTYVKKLRLGQTFYRIACCTVLEDVCEWKELRDIYNRRDGFSQSSNKDILNSIQSELRELKELIERTPKSCIIDRKSLEARLSEVQQEECDFLRQHPECSLSYVLSEMHEMEKDFEEAQKKVRKGLQKDIRRCSESKE